MRGEWLFRGAVALSIAAHVVFLAVHTGSEGRLLERIVKIPVVLEAAPPPPPPPPPEPPKEPPKKKARPKKLPKKVDTVVEGEGLRTGELVDAEVGEYGEEEEPEPPPPPPPPPPPKQPKQPEVDKIEVAKRFLSELRNQLMNRKRYPLVAQRMGVTGAVVVSFVVKPDSSFSDVRIKRSSGHGVLDEAAVTTVRGLSGELRRPSVLGDNPIRTSIMLRFELSS